MKDITRRNYLAISRKKSAAKKAAQPSCKANDIDEEKDGDENDDEQNGNPPEEEMAVKQPIHVTHFFIFHG